MKCYSMQIFRQSNGNIKKMDCPLSSLANKCIQMEVPVISLLLKYVDDFHKIV